MCPQPLSKWRCVQVYRQRVLLQLQARLQGADVSLAHNSPPKIPCLQCFLKIYFRIKMQEEMLGSLRWIFDVRGTVTD